MNCRFLGWRMHTSCSDMFTCLSDFENVMYNFNAVFGVHSLFCLRLKLSHDKCQNMITNWQILAKLLCLLPIKMWDAMQNNMGQYGISICFRMADFEIVQPALTWVDLGVYVNKWRFPERGLSPVLIHFKSFQ